MKIKNKIFICDNYIITSRKGHTVNQLKLFYHLLYKFREINYFENNLEFNDVLQDEIILDNLEVKKMFIEKNYTELDIQELIESIPDNVILIHKDGSEIVKLFIFDYIQYIKFDCAIFKFSEHCFEYINNIYKSFSLLDLNEFNMLKSKHSQRLYELSCKYSNQKHYTMPIYVIRKFFQIEKKYINAEINRTVIKPSIEEVNHKTSKFITAASIKKNGKLTHIKFMFN